MRIKYKAPRGEVKQAAINLLISKGKQVIQSGDVEIPHTTCRVYFRNQELIIEEHFPHATKSGECSYTYTPFVM